MSEKKYIQCVERAMSIIECIGNRKVTKLNEICEDLGLKPPTAHALIQTLEHRGYVTRVEKTHYSLGVNCLKLGLLYENSSDEKKQIHKLLTEMVSEVGETCYFEFKIGSYNYFYDVILSSQTLKVVPDYDKDYIKLPENSAVNKLYDSYSSGENIKYATDLEHVEEGLHCMAIPFKTDGEITATIAFTGPSNRFTEEKMEEAYGIFLNVMRENNLEDRI